MPLIFCRFKHGQGKIAFDASSRFESALSDLAGSFSVKYRDDQALAGVFQLKEEDGCGSSDFSNDWICLFDGRVDNLEELLRKYGCRQIDGSVCPAQALNRLWKLVGERLFVDLIGDYAIGFLNTKERKVYLARDAAGTRPLYFFASGDSLTVASDLRMIKELHRGSFQLNEEAISRMLVFGTHGSLRPNETFVYNVGRVVPGESVTWNNGRIHRSRFWNPLNLVRRRNFSFEEAAEELDRRISIAVSRRADFSIGMGAHVSGGLDCSSVASYLARLAHSKNRKVLGFSWTPSDSVDANATELRRIRAIAEFNSFEVCYPRGADYLASKAERSQLAFDFWRPWFDMEFEYQIQDCAYRAGVRHLMSGWGGDEFASGYGNSTVAELAARLRWIELFRLARRVPTTRPMLGQLRFLTREALVKPVRDKMPRLSRSAFARAGGRRGQFALVRSADRLSDGFSVRGSQWSRYLGGYIFDRMESWYTFGKRFGIVYSYPLMDRDVLDFVFLLPPEFFFDGKTRRRVFRKAVERLWPEDLVWRSAKAEPGLMGFVGAGSQRNSARLEQDLWSLNGPEEARKFVDRRVVDGVFSRVGKGCASVSDLFFLARLEKVLRSINSLN